MFSNGVLAGSPDRFVGDDGMIEVKCLARERTIPEALEFDKLNKTLKQFCLAANAEVNINHNYFHQVQGNLYATGRKWCDMVIWTQKDMLINRILPDPT